LIRRLLGGRCKTGDLEGDLVLWGRGSYTRYTQKVVGGMANHCGTCRLLYVSSPPWSITLPPPHQPSSPSDSPNPTAASPSTTSCTRHMRCYCTALVPHPPQITAFAGPPCPPNIPLTHIQLLLWCRQAKPVHVILVIDALKRRPRWFGSSCYEWSIIVVGSFIFIFYFLAFSLFLVVCILNVLTSSGCYIGT
jgi:hypothetical protein